MLSTLTFLGVCVGAAAQALPWPARLLASCVAGLLIVRSNGRIKGKVRYAEIELQRGGRLSGEVEILTVRAVPDPAKPHAIAPAAPAVGQKPDSV